MEPLTDQELTELEHLIGALDSEHSYSDMQYAADAALSAVPRLVAEVRRLREHLSKHHTLAKIYEGQVQYIAGFRVGYVAGCPICDR